MAGFAGRLSTWFWLGTSPQPYISLCRLSAVVAGRWWLVLPVRAGNDGIRVRDGNPAPRGWQGREVVGRWAVAFRYSKQDNLQVRRDGCVLHRKWIGLDGKSENGG